MHPENLHSPPYRTLPDEQQSRKPIRKKWKSNEARATQQREKKRLAMGILKILWERPDKLSYTPRRPQKRQQQLNSLYPATSSTHPSKSVMETASSRVNRPLAVRRNAER